MHNDKANSAHARKTQANPLGNGRPAVTDSKGKREDRRYNKKKRGNRKGEGKRLNGIYKKDSGSEGFDKTKRQKKEEDDTLR